MASRKSLPGGPAGGVGRRTGIAKPSAPKDSTGMERPDAYFADDEPVEVSHKSRSAASTTTTSSKPVASSRKSLTAAELKRQAQQYRDEERESVPELDSPGVDDDSTIAVIRRGKSEQFRATKSKKNVVEVVVASGSAKLKKTKAAVPAARANDEFAFQPAPGKEKPSTAVTPVVTKTKQTTASSAKQQRILPTPVRLNDSFEDDHLGGDFSATTPASATETTMHPKAAKAGASGSTKTTPKAAARPPLVEEMSTDRPKRKHIQPVKFWLGELPIYRPSGDDDLPSMQTVSQARLPEPTPKTARPRKPAPTANKVKKPKAKQDDDFTDFDDDDLLPTPFQHGKRTVHTDSEREGTSDLEATPAPAKKKVSKPKAAVQKRARVVSEDEYDESQAKRPAKLSSSQPVPEETPCMQYPDGTHMSVPNSLVRSADDWEIIQDGRRKKVIEAGFVSTYVMELPSGTMRPLMRHLNKSVHAFVSKGYILLKVAMHQNFTNANIAAGGFFYIPANTPYQVGSVEGTGHAEIAMTVVDHEELTNV